MNLIINMQNVNMLDEKVCEKHKKLTKSLRNCTMIKLYNCAVHGKIPKKAGKYSETANRWPPYFRHKLLLANIFGQS